MKMNKYMDDKSVEIVWVRELSAFFRSKTVPPQTSKRIWTLTIGSSAEYEMLPEGVTQWEQRLAHQVLKMGNKAKFVSLCAKVFDSG